MIISQHNNVYVHDMHNKLFLCKSNVSLQKIK
jgi:hypothetical protein